MGSTGSYFTSRYLKKNNLTPSDVKVINLETNHMVPALDRGDIDGFFIWEPHLAIALRTSGAKVRKLTIAEGYINGYSLMGARPQWLATNRDVVTRYLRALRRSATEVTRDKDLGGGDPRLIAQNLLPEFGFSADQFSCLDSLWTKESGWNPAADNPTSSAFGIPQALPGSKMASAGPDWATNPATQIRWGLGYIADVYGTPCSAWSHSQSYNWY